MKKIYSFLTASAMIAMSVCGFSSCSNDNELDEVANNALQASSDVVKQDEEDAKKMTPEQMADAMAQLEQIANQNATDTASFSYDKLGATSVDNEIHNDYFNSMNTRGDNDLIVGILKWGGEKAFWGAVGKAGGMVLNSVFESMGYESKQAKALNSINDRMTDLNKAVSGISDRMDGVAKQLDGIINKDVVIEMAKMYRDRCKAYTSLNNETSLSYSNMMKCLGRGDYEGASQEAAKWANTNVLNGNGGVKALESYLLTMTTNFHNSEHYSMPQVYDFWVYQLTPWEHEGYAMREALRNADIATAVMGMKLSDVYYSTSGIENAEQYYNRLASLYNTFRNIYEANQVHHHNDRIICQIKDAHIVFYKHFNFPDIKARGTDRNYKLKFEKVTTFEDNNKQNFLTPQEVQAIASYYKIKNLSELEAKFGELGFGMSDFSGSKPHLLMLSGGYETKNTDHSIERIGWLTFNTHNYYDVTLKQTLCTNDSDITPRPYYLGSLDCIFSLIRIGGWYANTWRDGHKCNDVQFYHTNIESRYNGVYPKGF